MLCEIFPLVIQLPLSPQLTKESSFLLQPYPDVNEIKPYLIRLWHEHGTWRARPGFRYRDNHHVGVLFHQFISLHIGCDVCISTTSQNLLKVSGRRFHYLMSRIMGRIFLTWVFLSCSKSCRNDHIRVIQIFPTTKAISVFS